MVPSEGRGPTLQSSRSLDALSDLKLQRLEAELEGARHQAEGACQRETELRAELQRLQQEVAQLQDAHSQVRPQIHTYRIELRSRVFDRFVSLSAPVAGPACTLRTLRRGVDQESRRRTVRLTWMQDNILTPASIYLLSQMYHIGCPSVVSVL